jgi:hypothetical protein
LSAGLVASGELLGASESPVSLSLFAGFGPGGELLERPRAPGRPVVLELCSGCGASAMARGRFSSARMVSGGQCKIVERTEIAVPLAASWAASALASERISDASAALKWSCRDLYLFHRVDQQQDAFAAVQLACLAKDLDR